MARIHKLLVLVLVLIMAVPVFAMASDHATSASNDQHRSEDPPEEPPGEVEKEEEIEPDPLVGIIHWLFSLPAGLLGWFAV